MPKRSKDDFLNDSESNDDRRRKDISAKRSGTLSRRRFLGGMGAAAVAAAVGCKDRSSSGVDVDGGPDVREDGGVDADGGPSGSEPAQVTGLVQTGATPTSITMTWDEAEAADTYNVYVDEAEEPALNFIAETGTSLPGLSGDSSYSIRVAGVNDVGEGEKSDPVAMTTAAGDLSVLKAFPTAVGGGGMLSVGGRGGRIVEVTNLNDSGPGSLRDACGQEGPRIVIFRVGGTIDLMTHLRVSNPYITIAGQTAPGDGICLRQSSDSTRWCSFLIETSDVVVQHMRFRLFPSSYGDLETNSINVLTGERIIIDHCSLSWANDEVLTVWGDTTYLTVQYCIISEGTDPGSAISSGSSSEFVAYYYNLLSHCRRRNPQLSGRGVGKTDFVNNVIYGWSTYCAILKSPENNFLGNVYIAGPNSPSNVERAGIVTASSLYSEGDQGLTEREDCLYVENNEIRGMSSTDILAGADPEFLDQILVDSRFWSPNQIPGRDLDEVYDEVLSNAGCRRPVFDEVDQRIINDVRNRTGGATVDRWYPSEPPGGFPVYADGTPYPHSGDGISNAWKTANGFDVNAQIANDPVPSGPGVAEGWTYMDLFLAGIDLPT